VSISELPGPMDDEYVWYIGDPVAIVSLWRRRDSTEFPIYQQTRGHAVFNSRQPDSCSMDTAEPTDAFFNALQALDSGEYDPKTDDGLDVKGCEWYEIEFLKELFMFVADNEPPTSIKELFVYAVTKDAGANEQ